MSSLVFLICVILCVTGGLALFMLASLGEMWSFWSLPRHRVQFTVRSILIVITVVSLHLAIFRPPPTAIWDPSSWLLLIVMFPFLLGLVYFLGLLACDLYQGITGSQGRSMRVFRATRKRVMQTRESGEPIVGTEPPRRSLKHRRQHPEALPQVNPFRIYRG